MRVSVWLLGALAAMAACGDTPEGGDLGADLATAADLTEPDLAGPPPHNIKHVVIVVQENHTFDAYFGRWCTAAPGSNPTCNGGSGCCEAAPATDPSTGAMPVVLDDASNAGYDRKHSSACETAEMNGGAMDRYVAGASCSDPRNFAIAPSALVFTYHRWAAEGALADRYFQPLVGESSSNDMYFAVAQYVFTDNAYKPDTNGAGCTLPATRIVWAGRTTLGDLLIQAGKGFAFYAEGYARMLASTLCPAAPSDCPAGIPTTPCDYDPSDNPFQYFLQFADNRTYMKDLADFTTDIDLGRLPEVSFVKPLQYHNEHPGYGTLISDGIKTVESLVGKIQSSVYADDTLILVTWDEGGGFYDHVSPPGVSPVDHQPYGTRVPLLVIGPFARPGYVSHVQLEHSSIVRFLEWNFLGEQTGQLGGRDAVVRSIGDLLDGSKTALPPD